jgi:hypothetical protein
MKKFFAFAVLAAIVLSVSCGGGAYGDIKAAVDGAYNATTKFAKDMESANDGKAVAAALTAWAKSMSAFSTEMEKLEEKYKDLDMDNPPAELAETMAKFEKHEGDEILAPAFEKMFQYMSDPES